MRRRRAKSASVLLLVTYLVAGIYSYAFSEDADTEVATETEAETALGTETEAETEFLYDDGYEIDPEQLEAAEEMDTSNVVDVEDQIERTEVSGTDEITPDMLVDGTYEISTQSSSSMFIIDACELVVKGNYMYANITLDGTGYYFLYPGPVEEAAAADPEDFIYYRLDDDGYRVYMHFPIEALDAETDCSSFSVNKNKWYRRTLVFETKDLPDDAYAVPQGTTVEELSLSDGTYTAGVSISGSGSLQVISPMTIVISDGEASGTLVFDSSKYDYVKIDDVQYDAVEGEENSTFIIPVDVFDDAIDIIADSTAIAGKQVEKDYKITVDSSSLEVR